VQENPQDIEAVSATSSGGESADANPQDEEYPFSLFRGTVESIVTCASCGASSSTRDPIEDVGLEVTTPPTAPKYRSERYSRSSARTTSPTTPANTPLWDVKTAFKRYASKEDLDSGYKCEKCGKVGRASKQSRLASIPPILTLHLKRFRYGDRAVTVPTTTRRSGRSTELSQLLGSGDALGGKSGSTKIEGHVKFDMIFDLSPYMTTTNATTGHEDMMINNNNNGKMFCRLFAVIVHAGKNSNSGHYIAFVRDVSKNEWWKMDDSRATPVSQDEVLSAEAYMLFYRLVNHPVVQRLMERKNQTENPIPDSTKAKVSSENQQPSSSPLPESAVLKKRPAEVYMTGKEWARKVNFPPNWIGVVQKVSDLIATDIRASPRTHAAIREELRKVSAMNNDKKDDTMSTKPAESSYATILKSDNIVSVKERCTETETYKRMLCELFYKLRDHPGAAATVLSSLRVVGGGGVSASGGPVEGPPAAHRRPIPTTILEHSAGLL
jgi:hypothetical protein